MRRTVRSSSARRVVFPFRSASVPSDNDAGAPSNAFDTFINPNRRIVELDDEDMSASESTGPISPVVVERDTIQVPAVFSMLPLLQDDLETKSSKAQDAVAEDCRKLLAGELKEIEELNSHGIPSLRREKHLKFIRSKLETYPEGYEALDASRAWVVYWALAAMCSLGESVAEYRDRVIQTFTPLQNATGGFGAEVSHLAPSYAAVLSLAMVDALDLVNRRAMWTWLSSVKQADGSFSVAVGGEIDMRGAYCATTIITLLNLPLALPPTSPAYTSPESTLFSNLGPWIARCQTYEGGIGAAPGNEAHGAYAFCALACLAQLDAPSISIPTYLSTTTLTSWLAHRQTAPEGGFSGRTNKLVDACYSHWIGGCWPILGAALGSSTPLHNREGVVRYTLAVSQAPKGGLRDKPSARPDGYHSNYSLAGMQASQNVWSYEADGPGDKRGPGFRWVPRAPTEAEMAQWAFDEEDRVAFVHPLFVIPPDVVERARKQFDGVVGF